MFSLGICSFQKKNQGVIMVTFVPRFITCNSSDPGSIADVASKNERLGSWAVFDTLLLDHINHIRSIAGIESLGLGADYDGIKR